MPLGSIRPAIRRSVLALGLLLWTVACKQSAMTNSSLRADEAGGPSSDGSELGVTILRTLPSEAQALFKGLVGENPFRNPCVDRANPKPGNYNIDERVNCFPDHYFSTAAPPVLPPEFKFIDVTVSFRYIDTSNVEVGTPTDVTHQWRGLKLNNRIVAFKKRNFSLGGEVAEDVALRGDWWVPLLTCPVTVLEGASLEAKLKHCLDAKIYEPANVANINQNLDDLEAAISLIPVVGSYNDLRYHDGGVRAAAWLIGDIATFGLASKAKVVARGSAIAIASTIPVRIGTSVANIASGQGSFVDFADGILATVEGSFAVFRVVRLSRAVGEGVVTIRPGNASEAQELGADLGEDPDDLLRQGINAEDAAKLNLGDDVANHSAAARRQPPCPPARR